MFVGVSRIPTLEARKAFSLNRMCFFFLLKKKKASYDASLSSWPISTQTKGGKEEAVKVLFVYLCKRSFGLCYKGFYVPIELLSVHILPGDSFLPQSPGWFITSRLPSRDSLF